MARPDPIQTTRTPLADQSDSHDDSHGETEARLEQAMDLAGLGLITVDYAADTVLADAQAADLFGLPADVPVARERLHARIHPDDRADVEARIAAALAGDGAFTIEHRLLRPDGSVAVVQVRKRVVFAGDPRRPARAVVIVADRTQVHAAAARTRTATDTLKTALIAAHLGTFEFDPDVDVPTVDDRARSILALPAGMPMDAFAARVHAEDRAAFDRFCVAAAERKAEPTHVEYRLHMPDGGVRWIEASAWARGAGSSLCVVGTVGDVTERRTASDALAATRAALAESEARAQRTLDGLPIFAGICSPSGTVEYINRAALDIYGVALGDVAGQPVHETVWWAGDAPTQARIADAVAQAAAGETAGLEAPYRVGSDARTVEFAAFPLFGADGAVTHVVVSGYDVTDRARAQAALHLLNDALEDRVAARTAELERSNAELDQFAYVASHDLKAPLRAIDSLASWIAEDAAGALPPESARHLALLRSRAERMERLLDSLLTYARAGRQEAAAEAVDTAALVHETVALVAPPEGFDVRVEGDLPTVVTARAPLELVVRNLVANAIKHHDRADGCVSVSARVLGAWAEFTVADDGPGIADIYRERAFGMFQTLRPRDEVEGSGMGLAIVRKTVEARGGHVTVDERPGGGARFRFTWPLHP